MKLESKVPAYSLEELLGPLPPSIKAGDEYLLHLDISRGCTKVFYKAEETGFVLGDTVEDPDPKRAVVILLVSLKKEDRS